MMDSYWLYWMKWKENIKYWSHIFFQSNSQPALSFRSSSEHRSLKNAYEHLITLEELLLAFNPLVKMISNVQYNEYIKDQPLACFNCLLMKATHPPGSILFSPFQFFVAQSSSMNSISILPNLVYFKMSCKDLQCSSFKPWPRQPYLFPSPSLLLCFAEQVSTGTTTGSSNL